MSFERVIPWSFLLCAGFASAGVVNAAPCDGLTATVSIRELPVGHSACDSAERLVQDLQMLSSLQTKSQIFGCGTDSVYVRTQLDSRFAASSKIDGFDLGKRLAAMKDRHPAIARVDVCKDVVSVRRP